MFRKYQKGLTQLEAILSLALAAGASGYIAVSGEQVQEAINEHNHQKCLEATSLVHRFPQLSFTDKYHEVCHGHSDR